MLFAQPYNEDKKSVRSERIDRISNLWQGLSRVRCRDRQDDTSKEDLMDLFNRESGAQWIRLCQLDELQVNKGKRFVVEGHELAVFRTEAGVFAVDDYCPHMGDSLSAGRIWEGAVICPRHMWAFRLTDGRCTDVPTLTVSTYQVDVRDGWVFVKKPDR